MHARAIAGRYVRSSRAGAWAVVARRFDPSIHSLLPCPPSRYVSTATHPDPAATTNLIVVGHFFPLVSLWYYGVLQIILIAFAFRNRACGSSKGENEGHKISPLEQLD
jgi:hypothetical protein